MARRFHRFPLRAFLALGGLGATLFALGLYWHRDLESGFYLVDAELGDAAYLDKLQTDLSAVDSVKEDLGFGFSAHRLKAGQGMVLAHRHFTEGSIIGMDDEGYDKLTVWLRPPVSTATKQSLRIPEQGLVLLSSGGSAWPRNDCSGYVRGVVHLMPLGSEIKVEVHGRFEPRGNRGLWKSCRPRQIAQQFQAAPTRLTDLSPWQGGAGAAHPYDETYAR